MATYDLADEAIIAATPAEIIQALVDEAAGRSHWWRPWLRMRQHGNGAFDEVGTIVNIAVNTKGHAARPFGTAHLTAQVTSVTPGRRIEMKYPHGDLAGAVAWTFDPVDSGHTRVSTRWTEDPHRLRMRLFARFADIRRGRSRVMREGFRALERYAAARRTGPRPA